MFTYKQLKDEVFKLIFSYSNKGIVTLNNQGNKDNMAAFPEAVNYAMLDIAAIKPLVKQYKIIQSIPPACTDKSALCTQQHTNEDIVKEFIGAKAYYFMVEGIATVQITDLKGDIIRIIENTKCGEYTEYKQHIPSNVEGIRIIFGGQYYYSIKNVMCYTVKFPMDDDIVPFGDYIKYDLKKLLLREDGSSEFLRLAKEKPLIYRGDFEYNESMPFKLQDDSVLLLSYFVNGEFSVQYDYCPMQITSNTTDDFDLALQLPVEALSAIPYLIAYRIGLEDDDVVATSYYNLYQQKKAELKEKVSPIQQEYFTSESGF